LICQFLPLRPTHSFFVLPRNVVLLLGLVSFLHFCMGGLLGLSVDEAHYALYAAHLDWSYFDHPPLVGWVQWPLVALNAPTVVLRLVPEVLWLGTAILVFRLTGRLATQAPSQSGFWAVLAFALAPLPHVLGIGLLPDTLLMFFTLALMWITLDLLDATTARRPLPWLALGVALGLAGLSKYTAILAAVAVALCLVGAQGVAILRNRWLWMAVVVALVLVMPVAYWNYNNHWISFSYQAKHGAGGGWQVAHVLRFLVLQLLVYGPLLLWGWVGLGPKVGASARSLLLFFGVPFLVLAALSGGGTSLPHWTAPAWVALAPFAGIGLARALQRGRRWVIVALALAQALVCAVVFGLMLTAGLPFITNTTGQGNSSAPSNPFADLHGWDAAGEHARALAAQHQLHSVSVQNWTLASRLGWYARPLPVHVLEDRFDQFDLWAGDLPVGGDTLLVDWSQLAYALPLGAHGFADCTLLDTQDVRRLGIPIASFRFHACHNWSGQPQPRLQGAS
jgi:hypothetical protein